jgi:hypothetical protein
LGVKLRQEFPELTPADLSFVSSIIMEHDVPTTSSDESVTDIMSTKSIKIIQQVIKMLLIGGQTAVLCGPIGVAFSGRTQTRTSDSYGKFMDTVIIWNFPGKDRRPYPRYKM